MHILLAFIYVFSAVAAIPTSTAILPAAVGQAAPDFKLLDSEGKGHSH